MKNFKISILAAATILFATSCSNDPEPVNEEEVITTVVLEFSRNGAVAATLTSKDADGDGPAAPQVTQTGRLNRSLVYTGTVRFLNELENPAEDKTAEIRAEDDEHQVFFQAPAGLGVFTTTDFDRNRNPLGLSFGFTAGTASTVQDLIVTLRHKLMKTAAGVAAGNIANAGGSTDAEVTFKVTLAP